MMNDIIATQSLVGVTKAGCEFEVMIQIGCPRQQENEPAECAVMVVGLQDKPRKIYGITTFQALNLALNYAYLFVSEFLQSEGKLYFADDEKRTAVPLSLLFPSRYLPTDGPSFR
jgi:hypothetical protein